MALLAAAVRSQPDRRLIRLFREGHDVAFDEIVRRYQGDLVSYARRIVPADHADDVVQEAFARAYVALRRPPVVLKLKPWLLRIVRNRALNDRRDERDHQPLSDQVTTSFRAGTEPEPTAQVREKLAAVVKGVKELPQGQRDALVMSELGGLTHDQIAVALGSSRGAVRQLVFRGRTALRNGLGLLVPLPLIRHLHDAESLGAGAGVGGALTSGAGAGGAVGGGGAVAAKATAGIAAVALAVGAGAGLDRGRDGRPTPDRIDVERASPLDGGTARAGQAAVGRARRSGPTADSDHRNRSAGGATALVSGDGGEGGGGGEADDDTGRFPSGDSPSGGDGIEPGGSPAAGPAGSGAPPPEPVDSDGTPGGGSDEDVSPDEGLAPLAGDSDDDDDPLPSAGAVESDDGDDDDSVDD